MTNSNLHRVYTPIKSWLYKGRNWLYLIHAFVGWVGAGHQLALILITRSAADLSILWLSCLLFAELTALPRAFTSKYWVWKLCHAVKTPLLVGLLVVAIMYH